MSILKKGFYASQFPVGYGDPYWDDVIALIRCDGEFVDLKYGSPVTHYGNSLYEEGLEHLRYKPNNNVNLVKRIDLFQSFNTDNDFTIEFTTDFRSKWAAVASLYPGFLSFKTQEDLLTGSSAFNMYSSPALDYNVTHKLRGRSFGNGDISNPTIANLSSTLFTKDKLQRYSFTKRGNKALIHLDGELVSSNTIENLDYDNEIVAIFFGSMYDPQFSTYSPGIASFEEIRITQRARYSEADYYIDEPVFPQDKLPVPIYPKDPLYSAVVSLLRVQQGFLYDTKLNELTPQTPSSTVTGYYLDALKFTNASHHRVVTLAEPLVGDFTFEFTFSLDAINESLPFEYLLRLMDGSSPQLPVIEVLRHEDEPNKLILNGLISENIEVVAGFNRFAITYDGIILKCYLEGELKTTFILPPSSPISEIHLSSDTNPFSGTLEELRLTKGIRYVGNYTPSEEVFPTRTDI